jgi:hypothetical protein
MTMNSAQHLEREETQSQALNGEGSARNGVDSRTVPTQVLPPTQRIGDVRPCYFTARFKLINQGPKIRFVLNNCGRSTWSIKDISHTLKPF